MGYTMYQAIYTNVTEKRRAARHRRAARKRARVEEAQRYLEERYGYEEDNGDPSWMLNFEADVSGRGRGNAIDDGYTSDFQDEDGEDDSSSGEEDDEEKDWWDDYDEQRQFYYVTVFVQGIPIRYEYELDWDEECSNAVPIRRYGYEIDWDEQINRISEDWDNE